MQPSPPVHAVRRRPCGHRGLTRTTNGHDLLRPTDWPLHWLRIKSTTSLLPWCQHDLLLRRVHTGSPAASPPVSPTVCTHRRLVCAAARDRRPRRATRAAACPLQPPRWGREGRHDADDGRVAISAKVAASSSPNPAAARRVDRRPDPGRLKCCSGRRCSARRMIAPPPPAHPAPGYGGGGCLILVGCIAPPANECPTAALPVANW